MKIKVTPNKEINVELDKKTILNIVFAIALILSFIFKPSTNIEEYEIQINNLEQKNIELIGRNDSLATNNVILSEKIDKIIQEIEVTQVELDNTEEKLIKLEGERNEISNHVDALDGDSVAVAISDYLIRRRTNDN